MGPHRKGPEIIESIRALVVVIVQNADMYYQALCIMFECACVPACKVVL